MANTLATLVERFLLELAKVRRFSPLTVAAYGRELERFLEVEKLKATVASDRVLSARRMEGFLAHLAVQGLSNRSIARAAAVLRAFLDFLHRSGTTQEALSERVPTVKFTAGLPRFNTEAQMRQWIESLPRKTRWDWRDCCVIEVLYASGARVAELVALNWDDFDQHAHTLSLFGKRGKARLVPIGSRASASLMELKLRTPVESLAPDQPVFMNRREERLTTRAIRRIVHNSFAQTVGGHMSPHRLRHTFATHLLDRGAGLMDVRELLGHESVGTTQVYTHTTPRRLQEVYERAFPLDRPS